MNKRGVGVLIKSSLSHDILDIRRSQDENILLLHARVKGTEIVIVSIYGPNSNDPGFFAALQDLLREFSNLPVILGGDWNCTYSTEPLAFNIDCLNMNRVPNLNHSVKVREICDNFGLSDPYRFLNPEKKDFTFVPRSVTQQNKSRIDFFLISDSLIDHIDDCIISQILQNKLFDHKAITLTLNRSCTQANYRNNISNTELDDDLLEYVVSATVCETYLIHAENDFNIHGRDKNDLLGICGTIMQLVRD
jgi:exonuclease III